MQLPRIDPRTVCHYFEIFNLKFSYTFTFRLYTKEDDNYTWCSG